MTYVERCLYEYKANVASISVMNDELKALKSVHGQSYEPHVVNGVSDPVFDVTARVLELERKVAQAERRTKPVDNLRTDLTGDDFRYQQMREVLELKYINHEGNDRSMEKMHVSRRTYWRRVRELLSLAKKYFNHEA